MGFSVRHHATRVEAELRVDQLWDGTPLDVRAPARIMLVDRPRHGIEVLIDAPHRHDPLPNAPPGRLDGLWAYEVVELFLLGDEARYLEVEVGPGGHHLALAFAGQRVRVDDDVPIHVEPTSGSAVTEAGASRWTARLSIMEEDIPPGWREGGRRCNAYTIHGAPEARCYAVAHVLGTPQPDFHAIAAFPALTPP